MKFLIAFIGVLSLAVALPALAVAQGNGSGTNGSGSNGSGINGSGTNGSGTNGSGSNGSGTGTCVDNGSGTNGSGSGTTCDTSTPSSEAFTPSTSGAGGGTTPGTGGGNGSLAFTGESTLIPLVSAAALLALALFVRHLARSRQPN